MKIFTSTNEISKMVPTLEFKSRTHKAYTEVIKAMGNIQIGNFIGNHVPTTDPLKHKQQTDESDQMV